MTGYSPSVMAYKAGNFLVNFMYWNGTAHNNSTLRLVTPATTSYVGGRIGVDSDLDDCPDGVATNCSIGPTGPHRTGTPTYFDPLGGWLYKPATNAAITTANLHVLYSGNVKTLLTLPRQPSSFVYDNAGALYYSGDKDRKLYKVAIHNIGDLSNTAVSPLTEGVHNTTTELPLPANSIACQGRRILIKPASGPKPKRLVFMAMQNGLPAISEYFLP